MTAIRVQPDKIYTKQPVRIRFTMDVELADRAYGRLLADAVERVDSRAMGSARETALRIFKAAVKDAIEQGVDRWRLVHPDHTFLPNEPITIKVAEFQGDPARLHDATMREGRPLNNQDRLTKEGLIDYVAIVWFSAPMVWVDPIEHRDVPGETEGFMPLNKLDQQQQALIKRDYAVAASALERSQS